MTGLKVLKTKGIDHRGFSLMEVLIALLLSAVVTTAAFKAYVNQHKSYMIQDDVTTIQQNARACLDQLSRQVRMAGYQLPNGLPSIVASNTNPDTITLTYHQDGCDTYLSAAMPQPSAELKCGTAIDCFEVNQWVYIWEADSAKGEWFQITQVQTGSNHLQHNTMDLSRKYGANSNILSMTQVKFYIDKSDTTHPKLMVTSINGTPQVYADDMTDLQFQYRLKNGTTVDVPPAYQDILEVLISVTGRSASKDLDRPTGQQYRFRTYSTSVTLRNQSV
jgi:prepilin-type N-terminal cleavage/methylation domain-containing protein